MRKVPELLTDNLLDPAPFIYLTENANNILDGKNSEEILLQTPQLINNSLTSSLDSFFRSLENLQLDAKILKACEIDDRIRAVSISKFGENLFGTEINKEIRYNAVRGLFIARGLFEKYDIKTMIPPLRFHFFFKNIEGLCCSIRLYTREVKTRS